MSQIYEDQYNNSGHIVWNTRYIWDAMDHCGITVHELAEIMQISDDDCRNELRCGLSFQSTRAKWIASIFRKAYGPDAPDFSTPAAWEDFIDRLNAARGSVWKDSPSGVKGFTRSYHQIIKEITSRSKSTFDRQEEVNDVTH